MLHQMMRFQQDDRGTTAIEYGVIAAGICVAIVTLVYSLGTKLSTMFASVAAAFN
jgi:pilus assembly protein Flp/PilA